MLTNDTQRKRKAFLKANPHYGYNNLIDKIRAKEFPHMKESIYLDHAGATIYALSSTTSFFKDLTQNLYGNPHSNSPSSALSTYETNQVRRRILDFFYADPDHWDVIFTANATAAAKIVAESFPWKEGSEYIYFKETHTSIVGIRASVKNFSSTHIHPIGRRELEETLNEDEGVSLNMSDVDLNHSHPPSLFSYPLQSNFNGARFPLSWISRLRKSKRYGHFRILLDAASYLTSSRLDLSDTQSAPDFVTISFYKVFGFPTGLGALLVRRPAGSDLLKNNFFGGGTVLVTDVQPLGQWQKFRDELHERFEDGTINFLSIIALTHAMNTWDRIFGSASAISNHVNSLTVFLYQEMKSMIHWNGTPLCVFYCEDLEAVGDMQKQGPIVNFNLRRADKSWVEFTALEKTAGSFGIHLRTGTFCNPGAAARHFNITTADLQVFVDKDISCSDFYLINNSPNGSIRVSLGAMSTIDDVLAFLNFLNITFLESSQPQSAHLNKKEKKNWGWFK